VCSQKGSPDVAIDLENNVHVVWEDDRNGNWEILWTQWSNDRQAWLSSGHFGTDEVVMTFSSLDPYQENEVLAFRHPKLALSHPYLWLVAEGYFKQSNTSGIYRGYRDLLNNFWSASGSIITEDNGDFRNVGIPELVSDSGRNSVKPAVTASGVFREVVIVWEDQTEPVYQIWGASYYFDTTLRASAQQVTSQLTNCENPDCGFISNQCAIVFEISGSIYLTNYNSAFTTFQGTANGGEDRIISLAIDKTASYPSLPSETQSNSFFMAYDYNLRRASDTLSSVEHPDYQLIGNTSIEHKETSTGSLATATSTIVDGMISDVDSKEFAFGDFSENVGMQAHWKDIKLYFGYNARPHSIVQYNSSTVPGWLDDRVNDLFVDTYGNIIVATFGGLLYYNVFTANLTFIEGHTTDFSSETGCTEETCLLRSGDIGKLTTSVKWSGNGIWYVGTTSGLFYSMSAGRTWTAFEGFDGKVINDIAVNSEGMGVVAAHSLPEDLAFDGVYIVHPTKDTIKVQPKNVSVRVVAIDENNIIWAGGDWGVARIENYSEDNILYFDRNSGMRSSYVNDITIVNKHLRYIATASGIERMHGTEFTNFNVRTHSLLNDNVNIVKWNEETNSLWVGSLYTLHEIVFRDVEYDIIENEIVHYDSSEISTEESYEKREYFILDYNILGASITAESTKVFINRNKIDFGFVVSDRSVLFLTDLLVGDQVEIETSDKFVEFHDFTQKDVEKSVIGEKRTIITQIDRTSLNQHLYLSQGGKNNIFLHAGTSKLPYTTIALDTVSPQGCIEQLDIISRTQIRFRLLATDDLSGLDGFILSNYPNFTSDGSAPLDFQPMQTTVDHDIGSDINNVFDSLTFPSTVTIDTVIYTVGEGTAIGTWLDPATNIEYLFAGTSGPAIVFRYDPENDEWTAIAILDDIDLQREIVNIKSVDNILFITTGSSSGNGVIYKSIDGLTFDTVSAISDEYARGVIGSADGTIYIGGSSGKIYTYRESVFASPNAFQNIAESIYSLDIFGKQLIVGTGNKGRVYSINIETNDNLILFDTPNRYINGVLTNGATISNSPAEVNLFVAVGDETTIYRSNMDELRFVKSYSSFNKTISRLRSIETAALTTGTSQVSVTTLTAVAAVGDTLFKYVAPSWQYVYTHPEDIKDFIQYESGGIEGIWVISDSTVTKWTAEFSTKKVYLRLRDKAGNITPTPDAYTVCPAGELVCCEVYSLSIADLKDFVNEGRIVDVDEYGVVQYTYDSPNNKVFFSAEQIDEEIGIYTSEVLNGSNDLVSWKSITWESTEPTGTSVAVQIRNGVTEDSAESATWSADLTKDSNDLVLLEHITDQYLQFRLILTSRVRDLSPSLTSVVLRNLTSQSAHFFTTNFVLPSRATKGLLTVNTFIPVSSDIVFGFNTKNSVDFGDYQIIEPNRIFNTTEGQFGSGLRIGAKLLSPGLPQLEVSNNPGDPYDESSFVCDIGFNYENIGSTTIAYHFRVRFYNDPFRTQLIHTRFSGNDQTGWSIRGGGDNSFPAEGLSLSSLTTGRIVYTPLDSVSQQQRWYMIIDAWNGSNFETVSDNMSFICSTCNLEQNPGLRAEYYLTLLDQGVFLSEIPDFNDYTPSSVFIESQIDFPLTVNTWISTDPSAPTNGTGGGIPGTQTDFAVRFTGKLLVPASGIYSFRLSSDDGSKLFINNVEIIDNDGIHAFTSVTGDVTLDVGLIDIEVQFFEWTGGAGITLEWLIPGESVYSVVPPANLFHTVTNEYCAIISPRVFNLACILQLENDEVVKFNLPG